MFAVCSQPLPLLVLNAVHRTFPSNHASLGPNNRTFMVSMYHQLHCLDAIRVGFIVNGSDAYPHIQHCLRFLRQILLCKADTTLEPADEIRTNPDGMIVSGSSPEGMIHRCRDWTKVRRYLEEVEGTR